MKIRLILFLLFFSLNALAANSYTLREDGVRGNIWTNNGDGNWLFSFPTIGLSSAGWVPLALNPDGTIGISASFSGAVDQGEAGTDPWPVISTPQTAASSSITNISITANTSTPLVNSNPNRKGLKLFDQSASNCYIAMATTSSASLFSFVLVPFQTYNMDMPIYLGAVSAYCLGDGNILTTEF